MKKRNFLQALLATGGMTIVASRTALNDGKVPPPLPAEPLEAAAAGLEDMPASVANEELQLVALQESELNPAYRHIEREVKIDQLTEANAEQVVTDYLEKIRNFDANFKGDVFISESQKQLLQPTLARIDRVLNYVGYANFNLLSFDEMLFFSRNYPGIGPFEKAEIAFLEEIFYADATRYGFFGEKVAPDINHRIGQREVEKIEGSGHYLLKGESLNHFLQIRNDVGPELMLTSGIRNNVKQMHLFLAKAVQAEGNLSRASRSLAPPGHSFHSNGDFDVGKSGLGELNFTADFSHTEEFVRLIRLGYVDIRYTDDNKFGVRYEPWHIKLV
jgi:zinc D-Ala-D-Ala carboxypeptidase